MSQNNIKKDFIEYRLKEHKQKAIFYILKVIVFLIPGFLLNYAGDIVKFSFFQIMGSLSVFISLCLFSGFVINVIKYQMLSVDRDNIK